jgi:hypothetical protein
VERPLARGLVHDVAAARGPSGPGVIGRRCCFGSEAVVAPRSTQACEQIRTVTSPPRIASLTLRWHASPQAAPNRMGRVLGLSTLHQREPPPTRRGSSTRVRTASGTTFLRPIRQSYAFSLLDAALVPSQEGT